MDGEKMDREWLLREVLYHSTAGTWTTEEVRTAVDTYRSGYVGSFTPADVQRVLDVYRKRDQKVHTLKITNEARALTLDRLQAIEKSVRWVRRKMFSAESAPFRTLTEASEWIQTQAAKRPAKPPKQPYRAHLLAYQRPDSESVAQVAVSPSSPMLMVKTLAEATGFAEDALVTYILTGEEPRLRPAQGTISRQSVLLPDGSSVVRSFATILLNVRGLTFSQFRSLYEMLRRDWQETRRRSVNTRQVRLLRMVKEQPLPPPGSKRVGARLQQYWSRIARECGYKTWRSAMNTYLRLKEQNLGQSWDSRGTVGLRSAGEDAPKARKSRALGRKSRAG